MESVMENNNQDNEFLTERLKRRPLNRRKLLWRMLITVLLAILFGVVASATILLLEPIISERMYPEEEPVAERINFPEDIIEEEILPEDMIADERGLFELYQAQEAENSPDVLIVDDDHIREIAAEIVEMSIVGIDEYLAISEALSSISNEARRALVTVTGQTSDVSWINHVFENEGRTTGVIVGATSLEIMVLANLRTIYDADEILLTFINNRQFTANLKQYDSETGLGILTVRPGVLDESTLRQIKVIDLGNSSSVLMASAPVIAIGRVIGNTDSASHGYITSAAAPLYKEDAAYRLLTTDIYGNVNASGILVNMAGQVVGIIDNSFNAPDARNIVSAIGISELKRLIETMCNNMEKPYFGIVGMDVTPEANENWDVPFGVYITEVRLDTPAMDAGLQSGDVIVKMNEVEIRSFYGFAHVLFDTEPGEGIEITAMRQGPEGFVEFECEVIVR